MYTEHCSNAAKTKTSSWSTYLAINLCFKNSLKFLQKMFRQFYQAAFKMFHRSKKGAPRLGEFPSLLYQIPYTRELNMRISQYLLWTSRFSRFSYINCKLFTTCWVKQRFCRVLCGLLCKYLVQLQYSSKNRQNMCRFILQHMSNGNYFIKMFFIQRVQEKMCFIIINTATHCCKIF